MSQVSVNPELLRWARKRVDLPVDALVKAFPRYRLWEKGEAEPTLKQLEKLSRKTYTPLGYFFLSKPPKDELPIPDFRTLKDRDVRRASPNLLETVQAMQRRQIWMREYLLEQEEEPLAFVASVKLKDDPKQVALKIRKALNLTNDWAKKVSTWTEALHLLRDSIEDADILTSFNGVVGNNTHRKLDVDEFRGFVLVDEYAPLIFVNSVDAKGAQMFTLAHELAHLWLGEGGVFNLRQLQPATAEVEVFCNQVAAEFLVPEEDMRREWMNVRDKDDSYHALARRFKVSPIVIARRALDLKLIAKDQFFDFYNAYMEDEERKSKARKSGGDYYLTQNVRVGRRFAEAVIRAAREGSLLYRDAYHLTGLSGKTFDEFASRIGM